MLGMTYTQCKSCLLDGNAKDDLDRWIDEGKSAGWISVQLVAYYDRFISESSIGRHKQKHHVAPGQERQTLLGVVGPPAGSMTKDALDVDSEALGSNVIIESRVYSSAEDTSDEWIFQEHGIDPEEFEISRRSTWQTNDGAWRKSFQFKPKPKEFNVEVSEDSEVDLPTLYATVMNRKVPSRSAFVKDTTEEVLVVAFSDAQIGKVDRRGGTEALIERMAKYRDDLRDYIRANGYRKAVFVDVGDVIEGFENTDGQAFTNDISIMDQVDLAITIEEEFINVLAEECEEVIVAVVPSNHAAWRKLKGYLGTPADDWGIFAIKQIERLYKHTGRSNVEFKYPDPYMKSICFTVAGDYRLGVAHGDAVNNPDRIPEWWGKQVHGGMPLALADVLLTGHFHHIRMAPSGRQAQDGPQNGRQKWWLQAPTLDNGSSWYANQAAGDSDPGLMVFGIHPEDGFSIQSLAIL